MGFPITSIIIMLVLAGGMFYGQIQYKKNKAEWGKLVTIICGFLVIGTALYTNLCRSGVDTAALEIEKQYQQTQLKYLAKTLAAKYNGNGRCLIIHDPTDEKGMDFVYQMVDAFKEGFGDKVTDIRPVAITELPGEDDLDLMMEMYEITAEQFNEVIKDNKDCDLIIFLTALPYSEEELYKMDPFKMVEDDENPGEWIKDPDKKYPTVGIFNGYIGNLAQFVDEGLISAITLWKGKPDMTNESIPDDLEKAFNKRYMIVTKENIDAIRKSSPKLFPKAIE
jgi:hypothetical protein